ncbi:MAG: transporter [Frankiales bacterium]|nr:transporter [Frankiales bacterium]
MRRRDRPAAAGRPYAQSLVSLLAVVVALDYADRNALGAVTPDLKDDLALSTSQIGLLGGAFGLVGGVSTLIAGTLVDRVPRLRMLAVSALAWSVAMLATGAAESFVWLLLARAALGVVLATVGPAYPSLIGDVVPAAERTVSLGRIAIGQLIGGTVGIGLGALSVALFSWREVFFVLALPGAFLALRMWRLREPDRLGHPADREVPWKAVLLRLWQTPTAVKVLLAASIGSYYLAGAGAFSVLFAVEHYGVRTEVADLALLALGSGAVLGILTGSRLSDRLSAEGRGSLRLRYAGRAYVIAACAWLPALLAEQLLVALPFLMLGSAALAATIPVLDAVRIDVIVPGIRGRAEAVRTVMRAVVEGAAPLFFGLITDAVGNDDRGLQLSFLLALPSLVLAALLLRAATGSYDADRTAVLDADPV